jgi:HPr kinase/phosphorylase
VIAQHFQITSTSNNPLPFSLNKDHKHVGMQIHASCAAREGRGVLLIGAPGSGKSDLLLRLLDHGFALVADDRVDIHAGTAAPPPALAGLLEVRGLGIVRLPFQAPVPLALAVELGPGERLPRPARHPLDLPLVTVDPALASAPIRIRLALDCALGRTPQIAGAFA